MKTVSRYAGLLGILFLLGAGLGYVLAAFFPLAYFGPLALGLIGLGVYVVFNAKEILSFLFSRSARYGAGSLAAVLLVFGILVVISILSVRHPYQIDLTKNKRFTLSAQTEKVLKSLADPVSVVGFFQESDPSRQVAKDLFGQYQRASKNFTFELADPIREPARAKAANISRTGAVVVSMAGRTEQIYNATEEALTNAVIRVSRSTKKRVYFLTGHGEKDPEDMDEAGLSTVKKTLEDKQYEIKKLLLMQVEDVPLDAAVLVIAGSRKDPFPNEFKAIERYLHHGGRVIFMVDPQSCPETARFLETLHVKLGNDIIIDKLSRIFGADYRMPVISQYTAHPITRDFNLASFFPLARSVSVEGKNTDDLSVVVLAQTTENAWGETDINQLAQGTAMFVQGQDLAGPVPVAVVGSIKTALQPKEGSKEHPAESEGKFIVFGDSDFISNAYVDFQGNGDLFYSSLSWLADEGDLVSIRPKIGPADPLLLTPFQQRLVFWLPVVVLPLVVLLIGVVVVMRRRGR